MSNLGLEKLIVDLRELPPKARGFLLVDAIQL